MNPTMIFTQLLPLLVFIIVDSIVKDVRISIVAAIVFAAGQSFFFYRMTHQFDWLVFVDVGLIVLLGAISIVLKNDLFFKIKPAVIEAITIVFLLALVLAPDTWLLGYFGRMVPGKTIRPEAIGLMKTMLVWMSVYTTVHIAAVMYTAFYASRRTWAIVSGPGFYFIFIPVMIVIFVKRRSLRRQGAQAVSGEHQRGRQGARVPVSGTR